MLFVLLGTEGEKIKSIIDKESGGKTLQKFDVFSWDADLARSSIESDSLFGNESECLVFENISESEETAPVLASFTEAMVRSEKIFFVIESEMAEETVSFFEQKGAKIFDLHKKVGGANKQAYSRDKEKYNPFALPDAMGKRNTKLGWIEFQRALLAGAVAEELHARIWSKVRDMLAVNKAGAEDLGLHPFVYKKALSDSKNWPVDKLRRLAESLVRIYHDSRRGGDSLDIALEKLLLSI